MKQEQGTFSASGGLSLFYQCWLPDESTRAAVVIVHGAGDHSGRFSRLVTPLVERGLGVFGYDMRGYGRSPGSRGHIDSWGDYREDLRAFLSQVAAWQPGKPLFLFGYSLGALIALEYVLRGSQGLSGVILSGTPIEPVGIAGPAKVFLSRVLSRVWPSFAIQLGNDVNGVSRDQGVKEDLLSDPLHHDWVTARWGTEAMSVRDWVNAHPADLHLPVLFIHGEKDPFNTASGVKRYYDQIPGQDKCVRIYPGCLHETHNDLDHAQVAADIADWIETHL